MKRHHFNRSMPAAGRLLVTLLVALAVNAAGLVAPCHSQNLFEWSATSNSFYDIASNWTPLGPPSSIDVAQFLQNRTYEVRWDSMTATVTPEVAFVDVGTGIVTFQNQTSTQHGFIIGRAIHLSPPPPTSSMRA